MLDVLVVPAALCFFVAFVAFSVFVVVEAYYYQGQLAGELRKDLGFEHGTPYIRCGRWVCGVLTVASLRPGGVFARAGFREGDVILGPSITGLYKMLHRRRGCEVCLKVVAGGDGPPLNQRPQREITVWVPGAGQPGETIAPNQPFQM